jgi:hypothetical protein
LNRIASTLGRFIPLVLMLTLFVAPASASLANIQYDSRHRLAAYTQGWRHNHHQRRSVPS